MQVTPPGGQICNWGKWRYLVAKYATYASGATWRSNLRLLLVIKFAMFEYCRLWCLNLVLSFQMLFRCCFNSVLICQGLKGGGTQIQSLIHLGLVGVGKWWELWGLQSCENCENCKQHWAQWAATRERIQLLERPWPWINIQEEAQNWAFVKDCTGAFADLTVIMMPWQPWEFKVGFQMTFDRTFLPKVKDWSF